MGYANSVRLTGNVASHELRQTQSGQAILEVRMATNESFWDKNTKERKSRVEWHSVIVWGAQGESLDKILTKGTLIGVQGRLQTRSWDDKNGGGKRYKTEVVSEELTLLGGKRDGGRPDNERQSAVGGGGDDHQQDADGGYSPTDDDIPFIYNETTFGLRGEWMSRDKRII